jgi:hypothetical protein
MKLNLNIDINTPVLNTMGRQMSYILQRTINGCLVKGQAKQRAHMEEAFTIRRKPFMKQGVKINKFAKRNDLVGEISMDPPGDRDDIFTKFEKGGQKKPTAGRNIAIGVLGSPVRRSDRTVIKAVDRPRALLAGSQKGKTARTAFVIPGEAGKPSKIFVRRGKKDPELAYILKPVVPIPATLKFVETITKEIERVKHAEFMDAVAYATRTARK